MTSHFRTLFLRRKKYRAAVTREGVAKDFLRDTRTAPKVVVSHMYTIQGWVSHFLMRDLVF